MKEPEILKDEIAVKKLFDLMMMGYIRKDIVDAFKYLDTNEEMQRAAKAIKIATEFLEEEDNNNENNIVS